MSDMIYTVPQLAKEFGLTERAIRFYESKDLEHAKQEVQGFLLEALSSEFDKRLENKEGNPFQADFFSLYISEGNKTFQ